MKLEQQVTSLEISKRLKELGVKQESLFDWYDVGNDVYFLGTNADAASNARDYSNSTAIGYEQRIVSAFTCAELGEMLPWTFIAKRTSKFPEAEMFLMMSKDDSMGQKSFSIWYEGMYDDGEEFKWESIIEQNEAEARGKMLIYLIENGLLKV